MGPKFQLYLKVLDYFLSFPSFINNGLFLDHMETVVPDPRQRQFTTSSQERYGGRTDYGKESPANTPTIRIVIDLIPIIPLLDHRIADITICLFCFVLFILMTKIDTI